MTVNYYPQMTALARSFPTFDREHGRKGSAPGVEPFDAEALDEVAGTWSHGERCAVQFLLEVFHPGLNWQIGRFNVVEAFHVWDAAHREAFLAWAKDPWWP